MVEYSILLYTTHWENTVEMGRIPYVTMCYKENTLSYPVLCTVRIQYLTMCYTRREYGILPCTRHGEP